MKKHKLFDNNYKRFCIIIIMMLTSFCHRPEKNLIMDCCQMQPVRRFCLKIFNFFWRIHNLIMFSKQNCLTIKLVQPYNVFPLSVFWQEKNYIEWYTRSHFSSKKKKKKKMYPWFRRCGRIIYTLLVEKRRGESEVNGCDHF